MSPSHQPHDAEEPTTGRPRPPVRSRRRRSAAIVAAAAIFTWSFAFAEAPSSDSPSFLMPAEGEIKTAFGMQHHPKLGAVLHDGIDIVNSEPTEVRAAAGGVVAFSGYDKEKGFFLRIDHGGGWESEYRHLQPVELKAGDEVQAGERIGMMGSTGQALAQHLHFTLWKDGEPVDPLERLE